MQFDFRDLTYFVAVAEELSFTRAARRLSMSQPPLSQAISRLEKRLGAKLLVRGPRRPPQLTPAGRVFLREAVSLLKHAERMETSVGSAAGGSEVLHVGSISSVLSGLIPRVVRGFATSHPRIELSVEESEETYISSSLHREVIDVGFSRNPRSDTDICPRVLAMESMVVAVPEPSALARRPVLNIGDLRDESFITFRRADAPVAYDRVVSICMRGGFSPRFRYHASNDLSMMSVVACGLGVALVPYLSSLTPIPGVVYRGLEEEWALTPLAFLTRRNPDVPAVEEFGAACADVLADISAESLRDGGRPAISFVAT